MYKFRKISFEVNFKYIVMRDFNYLSLINLKIVSIKYRKYIDFFYTLNWNFNTETKIFTICILLLIPLKDPVPPLALISQELIKVLNVFRLTTPFHQLLQNLLHLLAFRKHDIRAINTMIRLYILGYDLGGILFLRGLHGFNCHLFVFDCI